MGEERPPRHALLRFSGELSTKARATRLQFRQRLVHNLEDALRSSGIEPRLEVSHTRIFAALPPEAPGLHEADALRDHPLTRVPGIQSVSFVERHPVRDLDAVVRTGVALCGERVQGRRFAIRARRVGERRSVPVRPADVARVLGSALLPRSAGVDLDHPEVTVHVELSEAGAAFFSERLPGPGGLPIGVEGRAIALVSGGFDSVVAAWQMLRRGVALDFVFCNLGGQSHLQGVVRVVDVLARRWCYGLQPKLHAIDFAPVADAIRRDTEMRYWQVHLKRMMLRAGEVVARSRRAVALVTGDAIGQVSSQTLQNLAVVSRATEMPVLRPLVGCNKDEIIALARHIGTFELSKVVGEYCAMVPRRPATRASHAAIEAGERALDRAVLDDAVAKRSVFALRSLDLDALEDATLVVERVPEGATLIDLRPIEQYRSGHHPAALHLDFARAAEAWPSFDRARTYVLCCEFGLISAHLAEQMRRAGFRAYHLRGGQRALMAALRQPQVRAEGGYGDPQAGRSGTDDGYGLREAPKRSDSR